jgi:signal transduction histidine kinase
MLGQRLQVFKRRIPVRPSLPRPHAASIHKELAVLDKASLNTREVQHHLLIARDEERKALARELHDQVIQELIGIKYQLESITNNDNDQARSLKDVRDNISTLIDEIRCICSGLRPPLIESLGLAAAIQSYVDNWSARTGITSHLDIDPEPLCLPEAVGLSLFRIVQEGLNNVRKHATASVVSLSIRHATSGSIRISIADDGCGMKNHLDLSTLAAEGHYGLLGINERVELLGGHLQVQNQPGSGLLLQVEIPRSPVKASALALGPTDRALDG